MLFYSGTGNTAVGSGALRNNSTGAGNAAVGSNAGFALTTGTESVFVGQESGDSVTTGQRSVMVGFSAGSALTTGSDNICIGHLAGSGLTVANNNNIDIGNSATAGDVAIIRIGTNATHVKNFQGGIRGRTTDAADAIPVLISSTGQLGTVSSSIKYKENVVDLVGSEKIYDLTTRNFNYIQNGPSKLSMGLIAEEVELVAPELCIYQPSVVDGVVTDELELLTVDYTSLNIMLLKQLQVANASIGALTARVSALELL